MRPGAKFGERWWAVLIRGIAAILFGLAAIFRPGPSLVWLVLLFGAYALVDGIFELALAAQAPGEGRPWGALLFRGLVGIATAAVAFFWPGVTALALLFIIASWAVITGVATIVAAVRLRKLIQGEWLLSLGGLLSIGFGILLFLFPGAGALAVVMWIGAYALIFGVLLVGLSFRLRSFRGRTPERRLPTGGVPTPV